MGIFNKLTNKEKVLIVSEAKSKLYNELANYIGWKFLKSQECLKKVIKDIVFNIQFYSSKYNMCGESIEINCEFRIWCKNLDKICNVNSIIGFYSIQPKNGYWYDISTESKLNKVVEKLKREFDKYVISLTNIFEEDYNKGIDTLKHEQIQILYNLGNFKNFEKLVN